MPSALHPSLVQDRLSAMEGAHRVLVEAAYDFHGNAQWESLLITAADLIALEAEMRTIRWFLNNV